MSRFLPAVITVKTLKDQGLRPEEIMGRLFGGIEENSASSTHPDGKRDFAKLNTIIKESLERLYDFQRPDGGWAWWKEGDSDHWMTAYVVWGLALARQSEVTVKAHVLERAVAFLDKKIVEEEQNPDMQAFILHALANHERLAKRGTMSDFQKKAFDNLWVNRDKLNAYTRALLALAAHDFGKNQEAGILVQNLENGVKRDNRPDTSVLLSNLPAVSNQEASSVIGTAHWGEDGIYWRWSEGGVEATAFALRALLAIDPQNKLIEPVTNWLIKNRRGAQWNSTRATAIAILSLNDYLRSSGELKNGVEFELMVNGTSIAKKKIGREQLLSAPSRFVIEPRLIGETNVVQIRQTGGKAPLYFALEAKFFSLEEPIAAAGNEIFVKREYFKLVGRRTLLKGYVYEREPLRNGGTVASGERIETVLTIEGKNNYEYLIFEDLKPAGFEAVQIRSGESLYARELKSGAVERKFSANSQSPANDVNTAQVKSGAAPATLGRRSILPPNRLPPTARSESNFTERSRYVYQELRDRKVAMFVD